MQKIRRISLLCITATVLLFSSCVPLKDFVYLQGDLENVEEKAPEAYRVQPHDNLYIQVISNDELSIYFNLGTKDQYLNSNAAIELSSYKVDVDGNISFPYAGTINVKGKTTEEIKELLGVQISKKIVDFSIVVKLVNRQVSLIGEFNGPGNYTFYKDRLTLFEAISLGRDLTDLANRHTVKVIREIDGEKTVATLDLTQSEILSSEFYYILPNDIIYVEPSRKFYQANGLSVTTTVVSAMSSIINLYLIFNNVFATDPE